MCVCVCLVYPHSGLSDHKQRPDTSIIHYGFREMRCVRRGRRAEADTVGDLRRSFLCWCGPPGYANSMNPLVAQQEINRFLSTVEYWLFLGVPSEQNLPICENCELLPLSDQKRRFHLVCSRQWEVNTRSEAVKSEVWRTEMFCLVSVSEILFLSTRLVRWTPRIGVKGRRRALSEGCMSPPAASV